MRKFRFDIVCAAVALAAGVVIGCGERPAPPEAPATPVPATTASPSVEELSGAMFAAVRQDDVAAVEALLDEHAWLVETFGNRRGESPLHRARSGAMARLLIQRGADADARDDQGLAPIRWAAQDIRPDVIAVLAEHATVPQDVVFAVAVGDTAAVTAALDADPALLHQRVGKGDVFGAPWSLLHVATWCGQTETCRLLLDRGLDVNTPGGWGNTNPLEHAAYQGHAETVKLLIERGVDIENRDENEHRTPLWWAGVTGRQEVVSVLLDAGARIDPELPDAVRGAMTKPYPGRDLPVASEYEAVLALLDRPAAP